MISFKPFILETGKLRPPGWGAFSQLGAEAGLGSCGFLTPAAAFFCVEVGLKCMNSLFSPGRGLGQRG